MLGLADAPPLAGPAVARPIAELRVAAGRFPGCAASASAWSEFGGDLRDQPRVVGQAEHEVDPVGLAPAHQRLAGEARVGAEQDAHPRPAGADLGDEARHLFQRPGTAIDVGGPQLGAERCRPQKMDSGR